METLKESTINPYEMENFNTRNLEFSGKPRDGALICKRYTSDFLRKS